MPTKQPALNDARLSAHAARYARRKLIGANFVRTLGRLPGSHGLIRAIQRSPLTAAAYRRLVGFYRPFASLGQANEALAAYANKGHENVAGFELHLGLNKTARPSDYAAMFHIRPVLAGAPRVFDLGGNVGNLFYCYSKYLDIPTGLVWQVHDLGSVLAEGRALAARRGAAQLRFTSDWQQASGADLLLASGSLHYLAKPLPQMVEELAVKPQYILINRTPLTDGTPVAVVQDGPTYRVACMLHNRADLLRAFQTLGYEVVDAWQAAELAMSVAGYPEHDVPAYSGCFLRVRDDARGAGQASHDADRVV